MPRRKEYVIRSLPKECATPDDLAELIYSELATAPFVAQSMQINRWIGDYAARKARASQPRTAEGPVWPFVCAVLRGEVKPGEGAAQVAEMIERWQEAP